ncbi:MAG: MarR family transcriptional regulator [Pseudomonadota bacterium]
MKTNDAIKLLMTLRKTMMLIARRVLIPIGKKYDLQPVDMRLIMTLAHHQHSSKLQLANAIGMDHSSMSRALDRLIEKNYVQREIDTNDRRLIRISLTEQGRELHQQVFSTISKLWNKVCADFSDQELKQSIHFMQTLAENIANYTDENFLC